MKRLIFSLVAIFFAFATMSAITPKEAYREICDIPTVQQSMPSAQFNIGSKISLMGAQTAQSVATKQAQVNAIATEVQNIVNQIDPEYFIVAATSDNVTTVYYAQEKNNGLFDILRIDYIDSQNLWSATFAETSSTTIEYLKSLQTNAENALLQMDSCPAADNGNQIYEETSHKNEDAGSSASYETSDCQEAPAKLLR